jgi:DNA (cytosine-5)-methyltransferase 1
MLTTGRLVAVAVSRLVVPLDFSLDEQESMWTIRHMNGADIRERREKLGLSQAKFSELTGIAQHLISSFELGKSDLAPGQLNVIVYLLGDEQRVAALAGRKKRYRTHEYGNRGLREDRSSLSTQSAENRVYTRLLKELEDGRGNRLTGLSALSLFSGCGGFSLGFSWAGFAVKGFVELEAGLRKIYRSNFPNAVECGSNITEVTSSQLSSLGKQIGKIDVIIGGPPCQGFSLSGKRDVNDPRNSLFKHYLRFVDQFRPKMAILENVRLLTSMKNDQGGYVRDDILAEFAKHGYKVQFFEINAKNYGVPQHRERVLFVAVAVDCGFNPSLPEPSFGAANDLFGRMKSPRTFADACSDLEYVESGEKSKADKYHEAVNHPSHVLEWLWDTPQGKSAHDNDDSRLRPPSGYNTTYKRQIWNEPAATVQTTFGMISGCRNVHPIATRSLTIREAARIQSFPDTYKFTGTAGTIRTGIGNAVPPLLAYELGKHVNAKLSNLVEVACL